MYKKSDQSFGSLWERYVFKVATLVIDSVSADEQTKLIHLIHKTDSSSLEETDSSEDGFPGTGKLTGEPVAQLAYQWRAALKQPLTLRRTRLESDRVLLRRALVLNQQQIESTQRCIHQLNKLIERAENTAPATFLQNQLLLHYQGIQKRKIAYLGQLKVDQKQHMNRLER